VAAGAVAFQPGLHSVRVRRVTHPIIGMAHKLHRVRAIAALLLASSFASSAFGQSSFDGSIKGREPREAITIPPVAQVGRP
jgi:hypothetical protein